MPRTLQSQRAGVEQVLTFVRVKPRDIFHETSGHFQAVFMATELVRFLSILAIRLRFGATTMHVNMEH